MAPNKFVAKIASDWNKPDGLFLVRPEEVDAFVAALPVKKLYGVGKVTAAKLNRLGVQTCADLRGWTMQELQHHFGSFGARLHDLCRGIDNRAVIELARAQVGQHRGNLYAGRAGPGGLPGAAARAVRAAC